MPETDVLQMFFDALNIGVIAGVVIGYFVRVLRPSKKS